MAAHSFTLNMHQKSIVGGYYTFRVQAQEGSSDPARFTFHNVYQATTPVVSDRGTSFRWHITPELKATFEFLSTTFVSTVVAKQYQHIFGKPLPMDVVDDSISYIRSKLIYLKLGDSIDSMATLDTSKPYVIELELKSVGIKETRIQYNWKLVQVRIDDEVKCMSAAAASTTGVDGVDDTDDEDLAEPSMDDFHASLEHTRSLIASHADDLRARVATLSAELSQCDGLVKDLEADHSPANFSRVYESWVALTALNH